MYLLRPDDKTNQIFLCCLIEAAIRCDIDVLLPSVTARQPPSHGDL